MATNVENVTTISGLNENAPAPFDPISSGDDHLKLIKRVLKRQFTGGVLTPGAGQGLNAPVNCTAAELNFLIGARSNIQAQIDSLTGPGGVFPAFTTMLFVQQNPPPGWAKDNGAAAHNRSIIVTTGADGGSAGGLHDPSQLNWNHTHSTGSVSLTPAQLPPHVHSLFKNVGATSSANLGTSDVAAGSSGSQGSADYHYTILGAGAESGSNRANIGVSGNGDNLGLNGNSHNHGNTGVVNGGAGTYTWQPQFTRVIQCIKG